MITSLFRQSRRPIEFGLLLALAFFLPLLEAPKNVFWLAYVLAWLWNSWRSGEWGGAWDRWDTLIAAWISSGYVVAAFAGLHYFEWPGATDLVRYASLFWCVKRSNYSARELAWLAGTLLASCALTLGWGVWRYFVTHERKYVELHSVGHVNHSAPYLAICASLAGSWLLACWQSWSIKQRLLMTALLLFLLAGVVIGSSRAAIGAVLAVPFVLGLAWQRRSRRILAVLSAATVLAVIVAIFGNVGVVEKQRAGYEAGDHLSHRGTIWRRAMVGWTIYPWFGTGIDNFKMIPDERIKAKVEAAGEIYQRENYLTANHAHNLYLNTLVERGLYGFAIFAGVLIAWAAALWRRRPAATGSDLEWALWGAGLSAWTVIVLAGIFNTTFHHEIAMLPLLLLGSWLSLTKPRG